MRPNSVMDAATVTLALARATSRTAPKYVARSALARSSSPMTAASRMARRASSAWSHQTTNPTTIPARDLATMLADHAAPPLISGGPIRAEASVVMS